MGLSLSLKRVRFMLLQNNNLSPLKAALYVRLSKEDRDKARKEDESESIINQQAMLMDYCKDNGIEIFNIYNDEDYSGSDRERPAFNRMINDAENKKFNLVLCKTQSRFARDMELVEKYINGLFPLWGIRFIGIVDNADSTNKFNKKQRQITSLVDQWYLEDLSENVRATLASKRKQGLWVGAFAPYGYIKDPDNKNHLIVDDEAAGVVRYVFDLYLQGYGITTIARKLNEQGVPNPATYKQQHGQPFQNAHRECSDIWHTYSISRMLSNLVYRGCVVQGMSENISYKSAKKRQKPKDEWDIVENTHEPIIEQDVWDKVQRLRASKPKSLNTGKPNIFARKIRCLNCGCSMRIYYTHHSRYFRCHTNYFASRRCTGTFVSENVLQREILQQIEKLYNQYADEKYISENLNISNRYKDSILSLQNKISIAKQSIEKLDKRFKKLYIDKIDEVISKDDFLMLSEDCKANRKSLEQNILEYQNELELLSEQMKNKQSKIEIIRESKEIKELDYITVNTLIDYIEVGGNKNHRIFNIHWNL